MADEKNKNVDPEEENENQFDDDEDFGLPDLDYDELDDEDSDLEDEPDFKDPEDEPEELPIVSDTSADTEVSSEGELDEDVEINVEDIDSSETEDWEKELEKELEEELKAEEASAFYEEESYADFETSGNDDDISQSVFNSDDDFEDTDSESNSSESSDYTAPAVAAGAASAGSGYSSPNDNVSKTSYVSQYDTDNNSKGKFAKTVVIGTLVFAVIGVLLYVLFEGGDSEPKKPVAKVEKTTPPPAKPEPQEPVQQPAENVAPAKKQPAQPNNTTPGEITVLEQRTGKSYVVIGSFFDGDMANDYAKDLANEGKSPMVIPPFKDYRFYRVAIAEFNNFQDAQASVETYQNEYGQEVWPLRY